MPLISKNFSFPLYLQILLGMIAGVVIGGDATVATIIDRKG